jgi:cytochrome P450
MRALFEPGFGQETLQTCAVDLHTVVRTAVSALRQPQGAAQDAARGVAPFPVCQDLAYRALLRLLVGIDADDPRVAGMPARLALLDRDVHPWLPVTTASRRAFEELTGVLTRVGAAFVSLPGEAVARSVLGDLVRRDRALLDNASVIANLATLLQNGRVMLRMLLAWLVKRAGDHPGSLAAIRAALSNEHRAATRAREFILEVLRLDVSRYIYREAVADCQVGPYRVPAGWLVRVCLRESHRDPQFFDRPLEFDPGRFAASRFDPNRFWPFGTAMHACFAERFVMAVAEQFLLALAAHDVRVVADGPRERVNRHWAFALPSRQLRVSLADVGYVPAGLNLVGTGSTYA